MKIVIIVLVVLVVLGLIGSASSSDSDGNRNGKEDLSHLSEAQLKKVLEQRLYLKSFLEANKPLIQMVIRDLVEKDFWVGLSDRLQKELNWLWLYRAEQSHTIYMVLNTNLRGEKALLEYEENSNNPCFRKLRAPDEREYYMDADALAAEIAAGEAVKESLRFYDGSNKGRKAIEAFNDADGFMKKNRKLLAPNLESWLVYSAHLSLKL